MKQPIISVVGGTGQQGGGVVDALLATGKFKARVATRNPMSDAATALKRRGVDVVKADFLDPSSLEAFFAGAAGAFVVTNSWEIGAREEEVGAQIVNAARSAGVRHLIWSTLSDVEKLSHGRLTVRHFTLKAHVDAAVRAAGFERYTFVKAPFYFQNFQTLLAPKPLPDGGQGWAVPIDPAARVIHAGDVTEVGRAVAAAFAAGESLANGTYLAVCAGTFSWNDFAQTLHTIGNEVRVVRVPPEAFDTFFPGAPEVREMFQYFEAHTYFGPNAEADIAAARALVPGGFTSFADWARKNMKLR